MALLAHFLHVCAACLLRFTAVSPAWLDEQQQLLASQVLFVCFGGGGGGGVALFVVFGGVVGVVGVV